MSILIKIVLIGNTGVGKSSILDVFAGKGQKKKKDENDDENETKTEARTGPKQDKKYLTNFRFLNTF